MPAGAAEGCAACRMRSWRTSASEASDGEPGRNRTCNPQIALRGACRGTGIRTRAAQVIAAAVAARLRGRRHVSTPPSRAPLRKHQRQREAGFASHFYCAPGRCPEHETMFGADGDGEVREDTGGASPTKFRSAGVTCDDRGA